MNEASETAVENTPDAASNNTAGRQPHLNSQMADDDSIEPDFEAHGFGKPSQGEETPAEPQTSDLDDEIKADLEALTAQFDAEQEAEQQGENDIPLDGLIDDAPPTQGKKTAQR